MVEYVPMWKSYLNQVKHAASTTMLIFFPWVMRSSSQKIGYEPPMSLPFYNIFPKRSMRNLETASMYVSYTSLCNNKVKIYY